jgi:RNA polymerase sigma-70 factor (ECF subfamily)
VGDSREEQVWALRAQRGDQEAFAQLVEAYKGPVYNLAYRMLGDSGAAEDAAQETFLRAYTRLNSYDPAFKFSSWILSIASHYCIDRLRRRRGGSVSMEEIQSSRWIPDERPEPEEEILVTERGHTIQAVLDQLPPQYREVIILRYWQELSYVEMAEVTRSTESAIKSRLHRARQMVAALLSDQGGGPTFEGRDRRREAQNAVSRSF